MVLVTLMMIRVSHLNVPVCHYLAFTNRDAVSYQCVLLCQDNSQPTGMSLASDSSSLSIPLYISLCLFLYLSHSLSLPLSVSMSPSFCISPSLYLSLFLSLFLSVSLFLYLPLSFFISLPLFLHLCNSLFFHLFLSLSEDSRPNTQTPVTHTVMTQIGAQNELHRPSHMSHTHSMAAHTHIHTVITAVSLINCDK